MNEALDPQPGHEMQKVEFKKLFTYAFMGISTLAWSATSVLTSLLAIHFFSSGHHSLHSTAYVIAFLFLLPATMPVVSLWLPLLFRRKEKMNRALLIPITSFLLWIPYA